MTTITAEIREKVQELFACNECDYCPLAFENVCAEIARLTVALADAEARGRLTIEQLVEIIDPEAMDGFQRALTGCMENGQPIHLAHHYAYSQFGVARDAAFAKAKAIIALAQSTEDGKQEKV